MMTTIYTIIAGIAILTVIFSASAFISLHFVVKDKKKEELNKIKEVN